MRHIIAVGAMLVATTIGTAGMATVTGWAGAPEVYRVSVTRVDRNLYKVEDRRPAVYVETSLCLELAVHDDAVLRYERYGSDNKLIFSNNATCDVKALRLVSATE